ncbi:MAG: hypothetical protein ISP81_08370 [Synechococcus sp. BS301-5m-G54]|uniref:hypothetical protein n=1 Tax=Synechococcales TaxID=1890424 RepID=UPI0004E063D7|nr:hypothetical protein [Synechococcus sp. KORDI-49]MBL6740133.1 hypothetical protein [Synechococcus sp. BS301-5m-G54]MBL6795175.1 hypothetical protein [Synechococcus sp. BS307-5m-G34]OUW68621.1 MAG: hypothetical protein CBD65_01210 [Synechococcus sp. TMED205]RCL55835.1 MAG: hypothetical protein DBW84_00190 [Synechococcus sp. MED-G70]HCX52703.1 hypothetical protein [Synechococcus sp. UBA9887]
MSSSCLRSCGPVSTGEAAAVPLSIILPLLLCLVAGLLAPEDPVADASICQRHHPAPVCRVW